ncbi:uncharacterized protein PGTG_00630 [Puccinia graminis f. sp. tritici CRL 75-36-700-3]|uniref:Uncharacterized protein n=1 Tax=Puccinia graminis f. sp. tritici (strain CRL 75-36-700-3 / race SCCL) TaxID=418459 RepID=E3JQI3_PUCGT|nr:uncharacterized protein PGTG_00630 [Puccinia graminis f. sp. tritici CRL 75-36-700-3]EFP74674.2 hypothetical protein PGTG_00630 [Puccinia graminis f. sp. tritici CRL 75-36-700-3]
MPFPGAPRYGFFDKLVPKSRRSGRKLGNQSSPQLYEYSAVHIHSVGKSIVYEALFGQLMILGGESTFVAELYTLYSSSRQAQIMVRIDRGPTMERRHYGQDVMKTGWSVDDPLLLAPARLDDRLGGLRRDEVMLG